MIRQNAHCAAGMCLVLFIAVEARAERLLDTEGVELHGTAEVAAHSAGTCHVREESHSAEEYEWIKTNEGQPLDLWELSFSAHNGSGRPLDHLIARYGIESRWPPCTNWKVVSASEYGAIA